MAEDTITGANFNLRVDTKEVVTCEILGFHGGDYGLLVYNAV
jgi:hypothetical protein